MRHHTIRFRLTIWYAATIALSFTLLTTGVWLALQHSIRRTVDQDLHSRFEAVRYYLQQQSHEGEESDLAHEIAEDVDAVAATSLLRIRSSSGEWVYRSPATQAWNLAVPDRETLPSGGTIATVIVRGRPMRILSAPLAIGVLQVGLPLAEFEDVQHLLGWTLLLGSPFLLLLAAAAGYWVSGRALRPGDELVTTARSIGAQNLAERLPSRGTGDELDRLSDTLNGMLARLESAFARIARFTADASHELRTPVAIIRTTAEVTRAKLRTPEEHEQAWDLVLTQVGRMAELIDDLLMLARADSDTQPAPRELMDAAAVLREACEEMEIVAHASGLTLHTRIPDQCLIFGDPEDLRRMVLILLDNAIKYTPRPGEVFIELILDNSSYPPNAVITVRDMGIGIPADDLPRIFDRFYRAAKDRSRKTGGAGLGRASEGRGLGQSA